MQGIFWFIHKNQRIFLSRMNVVNHHNYSVFTTSSICFRVLSRIHNIITIFNFNLYSNSRQTKE